MALNIADITGFRILKTIEEAYFFVLKSKQQPIRDEPIPLWQANFSASQRVVEGAPEVKAVTWGRRKNGTIPRGCIEQVLE